MILPPGALSNICDTKKAARLFTGGFRNELDGSNEFEHCKQTSIKRRQSGSGDRSGIGEVLGNSFASDDCKLALAFPLGSDSTCYPHFGSNLHS